MANENMLGSRSTFGASAPPRANWFSDLEFHWDATITVRKTGVKITLKDLTAKELSKFFAYLGVLLLQAAKVRLSGRTRYRVLFTPDRPRPWYVVWSAATLAGVKFVREDLPTLCGRKSIAELEYSSAGAHLAATMPN